MKSTSPRHGGDAALGERLEELYATYNRRLYVHPDPLEFLYAHDDARDREIVGLVASSLAFGNVKQILRSVSSVLERMGPPRRFVEQATCKTLTRSFEGFKHRYVTGADVADMLLGVKGAIERWDSLEACFANGLKHDHETVIPALAHFVHELAQNDDARNYLLPSPRRGSACKRLNLFLRWMIRRDEVDPGGWDCASPAMLVIPLDVHMHRISRALGLTSRKQAGMRTAVEITHSFSAFAPDDPTKYDFCLTRLGIRNDTDLDGFLRCCGF